MPVNGGEGEGTKAKGFLIARPRIDNKYSREKKDYVVISQCGVQTASAAVIGGKGELRQKTSQ